MLGEDPQQRAQLEPPVLPRDAVSRNMQRCKEVKREAASAEGGSTDAEWGLAGREDASSESRIEVRGGPHLGWGGEGLKIFFQNQNFNTRLVKNFAPVAQNWRSEWIIFGVSGASPAATREATARCKTPHPPPFSRLEILFLLLVHYLVNRKCTSASRLRGHPSGLFTVVKSAAQFLFLVVVLLDTVVSNNHARDWLRATATCHRPTQEPISGVGQSKTRVFAKNRGFRRLFKTKVLGLWFCPS